PVDARQSLDPRDPGGLPGTTSRLHHRPDHRVSPRDQEGRAARAQDQQRPHLRADRGPRRCPPPPPRRDPELLRRPRAADDGATPRSGQTHPRRRARTGKDHRPPGKGAKGENEMSGALTNHLWQSTLFAAAAGLLALAFRGYRAHVRYWLWLSGSLKFLLPFALLIGLGGRWPRTPQAPRTTPPVVSTVLVQLAQPFP